MNTGIVPPMSVEDFELMQYPREVKPRGRRSLAAQDELATPVSESITPADEAGPEQPRRRTYNRQKNQAAEAPPAAGPDGMVSLTPDQLSKLWQAVTGGRIEISNGSIAVSLDSFRTALLEKL